MRLHKTVKAKVVMHLDMTSRCLIAVFPRYVTINSYKRKSSAARTKRTESNLNIQDGTKVASAGADKHIKLCDLASQQDISIGTHDQAVRNVRFFENNGTPMVVSGSWDKTVKYWDMRQQGAAATVQCQERVYTLDVQDNLCVVGTADRYINVINLKEPTKFYKTLQSPLKWQTRVVSCFTDAAGFAIGSIEGRCAIQYVEEKDAR